MRFDEFYRDEPRCPHEAAALREQGTPERLIGPDDPKCRCQTCDPTSQNQTFGQCLYCGLASDDVLIGVCGACA